MELVLIDSASLGIVEVWTLTPQECRLSTSFWYISTNVVVSTTVAVRSFRTGSANYRSVSRTTTPSSRRNVPDSLDLPL